MIGKKIFLSTIFLLFSRIFFKGMNALVAILLARFLGVEQFGQYAAAIAFINLFLVFNDLGVSRLSILEGSRDEKKISNLLGNGLLIEAILSIILYAVIIFIAKVIGYSPLMIQLLLILTAAELFFESRKIYQATLQSLTRFKIIGWQQIIYSLLFFLLVLINILTTPNVKTIAYMQLFVSILLFVIYLFYTFKAVKPALNLAHIPPLLKKAWIFCVSTTFFTICFQIDIVMLSLMKGEFEVGLYSAIYRLIVTFFIIPQIIFQVILPYIYRFNLENKEKFKRITYAVQKYLFAAAVPLTITFLFGSAPIIHLIFGSEYLPATIIAQIISFVILIRFFTYTAAEGVTAINKQKIRATFEGVATFFNIVINLILIPKYSYTGAAVATVAAELVLGFSCMLYMSRYFKEKFSKNFTDIFRAMFAGIIMALIFFLLQKTIPIILTIIISGIVYTFALSLLRFFSKYDLTLLSNMMPILKKIPSIKKFTKQ